LLYRKWGNESDFVIRFTSSWDKDRKMVEEVKLVMLVHVLELTRVGALDRKLSARVVKSLEEFEMEGEGYEDVHEGLEAFLIDRIGQEAGAIGLGRSRNDHVATALRIRMRSSVLELLKLILELRRTALSRAKDSIHILFPTFTHLQQAQPSTFAHYMLHIDEELSTIWQSLFCSLKSLNRSPLGAGATVGTQVPLDRIREAKALGFDDVLVNSLSASSSRLDLLQVSSMLTLYVLTLSRFAEDLVVYSTLGIIELPDTHVSTSSLMPQKRNPVTAEVARAKASDAIGHLVALFTNYKGLPTGYNLDLQEMNPHYWELSDIAINTTIVLEDIVKHLKVKENSVEGFLSPYTLATDEAERRALGGVPYRTAHAKVASEVSQGIFSPTINFQQSISLKSVVGSPSPTVLSKDLERGWRRLEEDEENYTRYRTAVEERLKSVEEWKNELLR